MADKVTRRDFVKGTAVGTAAGLVAGAGGAALVMPSPKPWLPSKWDQEADVVIVGAGGSGLAAAIAAHDAGAKVLVLERLAMPGGNTSVSNGLSRVGPGEQLYEEKYAPAAEGTKGTGVDTEFLRLLADESLETARFLQGLGGEWTPIEDDKVQTFAPESGAGGALFKVLLDAAKERDIDILTKSPADRLIVGLNNEVLGVVVEGKNIKANKGVILATGGWTRNREMLATYIPSLVKAVSKQRDGASYGDGIRMAQQLGANLKTMTHISVSPGLEYTPDVAYSCIFFFPFSILVDETGQRFGDELMTTLTLAETVIKKQAVWCIFDEPTRQVDITVSSGRRLTGPFLSKDWESELQKGIIRKADTIEELAQMIDVDPAALKKTVEDWNRDAAAETDTAHGREDGFVQIAQPPFYAFKCVTSLTESSGGVQVDPKTCQVINVLGSPIPRLYAAGVTIGGFMPQPYIGSAYILTSITTGRIAGKNAAAEAKGA